jgi:hypothetical protein
MMNHSDVPFADISRIIACLDPDRLLREEDGWILDSIARVEMWLTSTMAEKLRKEEAAA